MNKHVKVERENLNKNLAIGMLSSLFKSYICQKMVIRFQLNRTCTP